MIAARSSPSIIPTALLISSLIHDHLNVYPTLASYERAFAALIGMLAPDALLVCAHGFEALHRLTDGRAGGLVWAGPVRRLSRRRHPHRRDHPLRPRHARRRAHRRWKPAARACTISRTSSAPPPCCWNAARSTRAPCSAASPGSAASSAGWTRRPRVSRVPVYEGFGSSYEKARSAIEAIALHFPARPAVVVFEPHTFSWRNAASLAWYDTVFEGVARVLLLPPPRHGAGGHDQLTHDRHPGAHPRRRRAAPTPSAAGASILDDLVHTLAGDEVVLLLSSGPVGRPGALAAGPCSTPCSLEEHPRRSC